MGRQPIRRDEHLLSSGISMRKVSLSPMRTVSTSLLRASRMRMRGGGASGAEVMEIISGSLQHHIMNRLSDVSNASAVYNTIQISTYLLSHGI